MLFLYFYIIYIHPHAIICTLSFFIRNLHCFEAVLVCMGSVLQILGALYMNKFRPCSVDLKEGKSNFEFLVGVIRSFK